MSGRAVGIVTTMLLAPVTAELLQAYLGDLGGPIGLVFVVLFFAPLYGGAALLIREVSVRTGRGWPGRLLMATAFGVAMPTIIDLSLFTPARDDIDDWATILNAASFAGIGWSAVVTWVGGHVLMSIAAPLVIAEALARRPGPWLGPFGLTVVSVGFVGLAVFVHLDQMSSNPTEAGVADYVVSAAVIAALLALAWTPLGRPLRRRPGGALPPLAWIGIGIVGMLAFDMVPTSWLGVAIDLAVLVGGGLLVLHSARSPQWSIRHLAALTWGAVLARTGTGFLSPLPQGTTWAEKITQNVIYLALVLLLGVALERRTRGVLGVTGPDHSGRE